MKYTKEYFIEKFDPIPEEMWTTGKFYDKKTGACCAMGHCGSRRGGDSEEAIALRDIIPNIARINDGHLDYVWSGETPKQRILNALRAL
jgi:hypothetical protein